MKTNLVKGFKDFTGEDAVKREKIRKIIVETAGRFGFDPAETPIVEYEEFVKGDNEKDEAVSDIFKLKDKGKRALALRYEFTFQLKRLMQNKKTPFKRYQIGPVFRDEPVSNNRIRQFTQCDLDVIGSSVKDEAEILAVVGEVCKKLNLKYKIYFNNRNLLDEILSESGVSGAKKDEVIREIDKLDKLPEKQVRANLKKFKAGKVLGIFKKPSSYFKKYKAYAEVEDLKKAATLYGIKPAFTPSLARGLSYYKGNIFEVKTSGMKETIAAGGSYVFNGIKSTGISFGLDRISEISKIKDDSEKFLIISLKQDKAAIKLAQKLRGDGKSVAMFYGKPSKALEYANSYGIGKVIFVGAEEIKKKKFKIKDMKSGRESFVSGGNLR